MLEDQLFDWEECETRNGWTEYRLCTLRQNVGNYPVGSHFDFILVYQSFNRLEFYGKASDHDPILLACMKVSVIVEEQNNENL